MDRPTSPDGDVSLLRSGDLSALERILVRNEERLRRFTEARIRSDIRFAIAISDVMQSTFLRVLKGFRSFQGDSEEQFTGWVVRILENTLKDRRRYLLAERRRAAHPLDHDPIDPATRADGGKRTSSPLNFMEEFTQARAALAAIKPEYQEVFLLRVVDEKSHREIAESLNKTEEAVRVQFARARAAFLAKVEQLRGRGQN